MAGRQVRVEDVEIGGYRGAWGVEWSGVLWNFVFCIEQLLVSAELCQTNSVWYGVTRGRIGAS